jgi:hypothetical protein
MLPNYVKDYLGRPVTMRRSNLRYEWEFAGRHAIVLIHGRTAADARRNVADEIARRAPSTDKRRRVSVSSSETTGFPRGAGAGHINV